MSKIVDQPERYFLFYPYILLKMTPCAKKKADLTGPGIPA
jgi:hypothetical protein